jgi:hypothetical protein|tara:strand:- start:735 stop:1100 length:366 start_codon:yes stop_codon:yes gene_type:complete
MSESNAAKEEGQLQDYSVDQAAGAVVLVLGAVAGLLQVIWMSKCHCKVNLCWLFRCERRPPSEEEMANLKASMDKSKDKKQQRKILKKEEEILKKEDEILTRTPRSQEPEPEPEMIIPDLP